jgi:hypothetical protein
MYAGRMIIHGLSQATNCSIGVNMRLTSWSSLLACITIVGCSALPDVRSQGEQTSGYTYIPLDPFSITTSPGDSCTANSDNGDLTDKSEKYRPLLESFPDNAVRVSIQTVDTKGNVTYGMAKVGASTANHTVTVDYINADSTNLPLWIKKEMEVYGTGGVSIREVVSLNYKNDGKYKYGSEIFTVSREQPANFADYTEYHIPIYVGVGLRVTANIDQVTGNANISGLGVIGAEAEANRIRGTLVVQSLGINGKSVAAALPIQSELNRTTAQNAVVAVGAIKALLYEKETIISPRVVGLYLPFPGGKPLVNAILSELSRKRIPWYRPCGKASAT